MTNFQFSLQRVLDWRRTELALQESKLGQAVAALAAVDNARAEIAVAARSTEVEVQGRSSIAGCDLHALDDYRTHVRVQEKALSARRIECVRQLAAQQVCMLEARRRCRLLERLRERRLAEWTLAQDRELEAVASESYMAQWRGPSKEQVQRRARL